MIKKIIILALLGVSLSGCFMGPMALLGPATSGFSTASLMQSGVSSSANFLIKKSTGKSISEHVFNSITKDTLIQSYVPRNFTGDLKIDKNHHI